MRSLPERRATRAKSPLLRTLCPGRYARRYYNTSARDYNIGLQTFPRNLIAGPFGFKAVAFFSTDEEDRAVPQVKFSGSGPVATNPAPSGPPLAGGPDGLPPAAETQDLPPAG
jgi:hypothetical protein